MGFSLLSPLEFFSDSEKENIVSKITIAIVLAIWYNT